MKNRLDKLLEKYFDGDSSLEEEKEIRDLIQSVEGYETEKAFFKGLVIISDMESNVEIQPKPSRSLFFLCAKIAAGFLVFLMVGIAIFQYQEKMKEEAYMEVMQAFALIQSNMQKGFDSMEAMEDFRHLNTTEELFELNQKK